jgi:hypothetical protein
MAGYILSLSLSLSLSSVNPNVRGVCEGNEKTFLPSMSGWYFNFRCLAPLFVVWIPPCGTIRLVFRINYMPYEKLLLPRPDVRNEFIYFCIMKLGSKVKLGLCLSPRMSSERLTVCWFRVLHSGNYEYYTKILTCIREVSGSNLRRNIDYT